MNEHIHVFMHICAHLCSFVHFCALVNVVSMYILSCTFVHICALADEMSIYILSCTSVHVCALVHSNSFFQNDLLNFFLIHSDILIVFSILTVKIQLLNLPRLK